MSYYFTNYVPRLAWQRAKRLVKSFLQVQEIEPVRFADMPMLPAFGWYDYGTRSIGVNVRQCRLPGTDWSWPGHKSDCTIIGITAHETGHHVEAVVTQNDRRARYALWRGWKLAIASESPVTSYAAKSTEESFAEAVKLFITNPSLLRQGRPGHYGYLIDMGMEPIVNEAWETILDGAPKKILESAENFANGY